MIYIYDMPFGKEKITSIMRYGLKYKLQKRNVMENQTYYSFTSPGAETILVIPQFADQYTELENKVNKMAKGRSYDAYKATIRKYVEIMGEDVYPGDDDNDVPIPVITAEYKDIEVVFEFVKGELRLQDEFEIKQNNIFGNNIYVTMHTLDDEESN